MRGRAALQDAEFERRIDLVILQMQPRARARDARERPRGRRADQRRRDREHDVGAPERIPRQQRQRRQRERCEMHEPCLAARPRGHPQRRARHPHAAARLARVACARVTVRDAPGRVVRRRAHDLYRMPGRSQRLGHLGRIAARAAQLGRVVDAVDQDLHGRLSERGTRPRGAVPNRQSNSIRAQPRAIFAAAAGGSKRLTTAMQRSAVISVSANASVAFNIVRCSAATSPATNT